MTHPRWLPWRRCAPSSPPALVALSLWLFVTISWSTRTAVGLPNGVPTSACADMLPTHGPSIGGGAALNPYNITLSTRRYSAGSKITVTLYGATFRGFFVQARATAGNASAVGYFTDFKNGTAPLDCFNITASAVMHNTGADKSAVTLTWIAPLRNVGPVVFWATVVQTFPVFWVGLSSDSVVFNGATSTNYCSTALILLLLTVVSLLTRHFSA